MGRKRMAHRVASGALGDGCFSDGILELALQREFMEVVPGDATGAWMRAERGGGEKDILVAEADETAVPINVRFPR